MLHDAFASFRSLPNRHVPKVVIFFQFVSTLSTEPRFKGSTLIKSPFLFSQVFSYLALAASSLLIVLRVYVLAMTDSLEQTPTEAISIAIWNRDRVMMTVTASMWVTNLSFLIQGESDLSTVESAIRTDLAFRYLAGE